MGKYHPKQTQSGCDRVAMRVDETIIQMARHPGSLQERLASAMQHMLGVLPHEIHGHLRDYYNEIMSKVTFVDPNALDIAGRGQGKVEATCLSLGTDEAIAVIDQLVEFRSECQNERDALIEEGKGGSPYHGG